MTNTQLLALLDVSVRSVLTYSGFVSNFDGKLSSAANNLTGAAYVYSINSTGSWSLNQRLICSYASPTIAPSVRPPKSPSSPSSSPVSVTSGSAKYSAPCGSGATFGFKVGIYQNSSSNSFLIIGAPNYCNHFRYFEFKHSVYLM